MEQNPKKDTGSLRYGMASNGMQTISATKAEDETNL